MNALMLRGALAARTAAGVRVMTAMPIHSVAEPFIRLRAIRHLERGLIVCWLAALASLTSPGYPAAGTRTGCRRIAPSPELPAIRGKRSGPLRQPMTLRFSAWGPFWPCVMSNSTFCPSSRLR